MNKTEILQYLTDKHVNFIKYEHAPIFSVEEGDKSDYLITIKSFAIYFSVMLKRKIIISYHYLCINR